MGALAYAQVLIETWTALMSIVMFFVSRSIVRKSDPKRKGIVSMNFLALFCL